MKTLLFLLFIFLSIPLISVSQENIFNKVDKSGRKIGYWKYYHDNDNLESEGAYELVEKPFSREKLFMMGITNKDSATLTSIKKGEWKHYDEKGNLNFVEYWNNGSLTKWEEILYKDGKVIGVKKQGLEDFTSLKKTKNGYAISKSHLKISPSSFSLSSRINQAKTFLLKLESKLDKILKLELETSHENIKFTENSIKVKPKQEMKVPFTIRFEAGENENFIAVKYFNMDSINIIIEISYWGYHLTAMDFTSSNTELTKFTISDDILLFYRGLDECELKIYPYYNDSNFDKIKNYKVKETAIYPLSLEFNKIDISHLPKDRYLFRIVNYRDKIDRFAIVNLK